MKIIGASIGSCVHVAGILNFLKLAKEEKHQTQWLGPAVPIKNLAKVVKQEKPDIVAVSYRLSPPAAEGTFAALKKEIAKTKLPKKPSFILGCTEPVAEVGRKTSLFSAIFTSKSTQEEVLAYLRGEKPYRQEKDYPQDIVSRIKDQVPKPVIRHHYGRPSLKETIDGISQIAQAEVLDVVSLGPDQNFQQFFFRPEKMDKAQTGAGGVPIRSTKDLKDLYQATRCGNYPIMRCYSGTYDLIRMADLLEKNIHNAWCAVPLFWYNVLDGRSERPVDQSIAENLKLVRWHAERDIPVEMNEAHHWSLREAHDTVAVVAAFLAAYNAKKLGVKNYISQYMLNSPPRTSSLMDLAKMLAKIELIEALHDKDFTTWRQFRAGLFSFPANFDKAKGQLAASTYLAMALKPSIYHVVGYCESHHTVTATEVIESCNIAQQVIDVCLTGIPDIISNPKVVARKEELVAESKLLLQAIRDIASDDVDDAWADPKTLAKVVRTGLMDAPHLAGNPDAKGTLVTKEVNGAYYAYDIKSGKVLSEKQRIAKLVN